MTNGINKPLPTKKIQQGNASEDLEKLIQAIVQCNCKRDLTIDELRTIYIHQSKLRLERFLPFINSTMKKYEINTCLRKAHYLAQVGHESGELTYTAEALGRSIQEKDVYDGYKGRGLIQLTFKKNYKKYGDYVHKNLLGANRSLLERFDLAADSSGWYWSIEHNLNTYADKNDLIRTSILINGGLNGFNDRKEILLRAFSALHVMSCDNAAKNRNLTEFDLKDSESYNKTRDVLAWGIWHNPSRTKNKGTEKSPKESHLGFSRFLELNTQKPLNPRKKIFRSLPAEWEKIARNIKG